MRKFNLDEYEPVEDRIRRFYADHEDGRILTQLCSNPDNLDTVVVRAEVWIGGTAKASGLACEMREKELSKNSYGKEYESVNYTSWVENCETSAIGRALANAGYQGSKRPSREEMQKVERLTKPGTEQETKPEEGYKKAYTETLGLIKKLVGGNTITADQGKEYQKKMNGWINLTWTEAEPLMRDLWIELETIQPVLF